MRKSEREIKVFHEVIDVLHRCDTVHLGIFGEEYPYVVPLSFGYEVANGKIILYVHGAQEGLKHDLITVNNKVCAEADICHRFADTGLGVTTVYESVIGFGTAEKIFDEEAAKGLDLLLSHCGFAGYQYDKEVLNILTVYKITLDTVTGKRRAV